jgi:hypothetical protein
MTLLTSWHVCCLMRGVPKSRLKRGFYLQDVPMCTVFSGAKAAEEIRRLLATLMVLFLVFGWTRKTFVQSTLMSELRRMENIEPPGWRNNAHTNMARHAARYVMDVDSRRPLVYSVLQLGHSWIDVVCNFLGERDDF